MIYIYGGSNSKSLDSIRRVKAIYDILAKENIKSEILVNDFRAQHFATSLGLPLSTPIESVLDIDMIAPKGSTIIIDTNESIDNLDYYLRVYKKVILIQEEMPKKSVDVSLFTLDKDLISFDIDKNGKKDIVLALFDFDRYSFLRKNISFIEERNFYIYVGEYFYIKDILELEDRSFAYDSQKYLDLLRDFRVVVTSSYQIAIDALVNRSKVYFLELAPLKEKLKLRLKEFGVVFIDNLDEIEEESVVDNDFQDKLNMLREEFKNKLISKIKEP
ncbi:MAG: hypothetical protein GXO02_04895 [Epsilonproteobacteria bacterium]|nr:hypothetical protein [Campylobacterota bacterium]